MLEHVHLVSMDVFGKGGWKSVLLFHGLLQSRLLHNFPVTISYMCEVCRDKTRVQSVRIGGQLTLRACMTTSWASSSPSKILRRVSSSALLRASTFIFSSLRDRERDRGEKEKRGNLNEELFQELNKLLGIINGFKWQHVWVHFEGVSERHGADTGWDSGSHLWPHWAVLRVINRKPLAYLHVKLLRDWGQLPAPFSLHCPLRKVQCVLQIPAELGKRNCLAHTFYVLSNPPIILLALYPVIHRLGPV